MRAETWVAGALAVAAVLLALPGRASRRRLRGLDAAERARRWRRPAIVPPEGPALVVLAGGAAAIAGLIAGGPVAALAGALYGGAGARALIRRRHDQARNAAQQAGLDAVTGLADDLRAGRTPAQALSAAVTAIAPAVDEPTRRALRAVAGAAETGVELVPAMQVVRHPGLAPIFGRLAAVWQLNDAGVPLAELLDSLDAELRAHRRATDRAIAQLAAARTTARLLGGLPLLGLVLGVALGVDPIAVVLHTAPGGVCAVVALLLQGAGSVWTERLGRTAVRP
jgi:tight adherence protein B